MAKASIKTNYIFNLLYQMIVVLSPIIVTPYLSRVLQADGIGMYQYVYAIANYFIMIVLLGTAFYGQREVATFQSDKKKVGSIFLHIQLLRLVMLALATIVFAGVVWIMRDSKYVALLLIEYVLVVGAFFDISWLFQGLEQFKLMSLRSCLIKIITIILIFILVKAKSDLYLYAVIMSAGVLIGNLILWLYVPRYTDKSKFSKPYFWIITRNSWIFFVPSIAATIYVYLDKVLLGIFSSDYAIGYYSQGEKIVKILITLITSLSLVLLPRITNLISEGEMEKAKDIVKYVWKYVLMISVPMTVGLACVANTFVPMFFGEGYDPVVVIMQILAPLAIIIGSNSVLGYAILIPTKKQKEYNQAAIIGCIVNLCFDTIFIPKFGAVGAGIGTLLAEFSVCSAEYYFSRKVFGPILPVKSLGKFIVSSGIMAVILLLLNRTGSFEGFKLAFEVAIGVIVYFGMLIVLHEDTIFAVLESVMKKLKLGKKG